MLALWLKKSVLVLDLLTQLPNTFFGNNWYQNTFFKHFTTEVIFSLLILNFLLNTVTGLEKWIALNSHAEGETSVVRKSFLYKILSQNVFWNYFGKLQNITYFCVL